MKTNFVASASELRTRAWNAMSATWGTVVFITFLISIASTAANYLLSYVPGLVGMLAGIAVSMAVTIAQLGLVCGALNYLRHGYIEVDHVKSMFPHWGPVVRLTLWESLFIILWMLPGMLVSSVGINMIVSTAPVALLEDFLVLSEEGVLAAFLTLLPGNITGAAVFLLGILLMFVLLTRAGLNYLLGGCCLIDAPHMGGRAALKRSKQLMHGHRWRYILMYIPVWLMSILISALNYFLSRGMDATLVTIIISILSIAPEVMGLYLAPVLYQELDGRL